MEGPPLLRYAKEANFTDVYEVLLQKTRELFANNILLLHCSIVTHIVASLGMLLFTFIHIYIFTYILLILRIDRWHIGYIWRNRQRATAL